MATFSFGPISGYDPVGSAIEGGVNAGFSALSSASNFAWNGKDLRRNVRYQKKMIRFQNEQNRAQAAWSAKEMPSLQMAGLRAAGLNPILSVTGAGGFHTESAASAPGANIPSSESYVAPEHSASTVNGISGSFDDVLRFLNPSKQKEVVKSSQSAAVSEAKAREARAETDKVKAEEERKFVKYNVEQGSRRIRSDAELSEHNATTAGLQAFVDEQRKHFLMYWLTSRLPFDEAVEHYVRLNTGSGEAVFGDNNELFRLLQSSFRNRLRSEDWAFFNQQLNAGANAAKAVGSLLPSSVSRWFKVFKQK